MKIDCGFWDKDGNYKEDIQEVEVLSVKELNEIELIKAQNEGLKKQNAELQRENAELKAENERLKKELKNNKAAYQVELGTYNMECGNLLEENKELAHYLACMTEQRNKANTYVQEIKAIVSKIIDSYIRPYGDYNQLKQILDLITKAEEE